MEELTGHNGCQEFVVVSGACFSLRVFGPCKDQTRKLKHAPLDGAHQPCSGDQIAKQRLRQRIRRHSFRMPLNSHYPIGIFRPLDRLDHSIRRLRRNTQAAPRLQHRLVMPGIDLRLCRSGEIENTSGIETRTVHGIRRFRSIRELILFGAMADFRAKLGGNILDKSAAQKNIQRLNPVADGEDRLARDERVFEQREIGSLARSVGIGRGRVALRPVVCRVNVRRTPSEEERVKT